MLDHTAILLFGIAIHLEQSRFFSVAKSYEPLFVLSTRIILFSLAGMTHANSYLAAFSAGISLATMRTDLREEFKSYGGLAGELLKLATLLLFGALISPQFLMEIAGSGYGLALLALFLARPAAFGLALLGSRLNFPEQAAAAWFGPKGFASVVYGFMVLHSGVDQADYLFHLIAVVIFGSIIAHSSTDVLVARWFRQAKEKEAEA